MSYKLKILVLATDYSEPNGRVALAYIHSRNKEYLREGIDVDVLSFAAETDYIYENIPVYSLESYKRKLISNDYDILVSHAPNLRNHLRFIKKYGYRFRKVVFFFHGHEVLRTAEIYPKPYPYIKQNLWKHALRCVYDEIKIKILKRFFRRIKEKSYFVFVSQWMANKFHETVGITPDEIRGKSHIIYNCVGRLFQDGCYDRSASKKYDFITIRNNLDGSKYCIDIVCRIAESNPRFKFCVVGKGDFFRYYDKPKNLEWIDDNLSHDEIVDYLNKSYCALLPTRADAQGVMACEVATFGIPLITSNIEICQEIFQGFDNVGFINNDEETIDISQLYSRFLELKNTKKNDKFLLHNTVGKEISLFRELKEYD